ncbi:carboxylic acid reductase [bacterium BMS3Bbin02]|nr:carboxylic acid reductase [bacterium BMS3Bbin02]
MPVGSKMELRVKGPSVTPGYWRQPELTETAFDDDGFFKMGDAGKLVDIDDPAKGLVFDGRIAENFKLSSGTWVHAGDLRVAAIAACAPVIQDAVVTGHDRDEIGLLIFPNVAACRGLIAEATDAMGVGELVVHPLVLETVMAGLGKHNEHNPSGSRRIGRALLLAEPPNIDANEITDKGYLNQRAVLDHRAGLVERLYGDGGSDVVVV